MARTLSEIYAVSKECRNQYLELTEFENTSKMSVLDAITWVTSAGIWAFENILDVFKVDIAKDIQNRINGTPGYYANALLKYQSGDELKMNDEGTAFMYDSIDENKRVVKKVAYSEEAIQGFNDKRLVLKIATGEPGAYEQIEEQELIAIRAYMGQIAFAGTAMTIVSRKGDILIPKVTVYYDGAVTANEVFANIKNALNDFIANMSFNGALYAQKVIDAIQNAEHVLDVHIDTTATDHQGIFIAQYDDDNHLIPMELNVDGTTKSFAKRIERFIVPNSGFVKESTMAEEEVDLPDWKSAIVLKIEGQD